MIGLANGHHERQNGVNGVNGVNGHHQEYKVLEQPFEHVSV